MSRTAAVPLLAIDIAWNITWFSTAALAIHNNARLSQRNQGGFVTLILLAIFPDT